LQNHGGVFLSDSHYSTTFIASGVKPFTTAKKETFVVFQQQNPMLL